MYPRGCQLGVMYGLPKTHKTGTPLRPIVSSVNTVTYNTAKFLVNLLKPISVNQYTCKDTFSFLNDTKTKTFGRNCYLVSLDVVSLFTNVPVDETIDICVDLLYNSEDRSPPKIKRDDFKELLTLAVKDNCFVYNGHLYVQKDGVAMGSPLGPVLANIFLCSLEKKYFEKHEDFPMYYRRYVDDTFCVFNDRDSAVRFFEYINTVHPNMHFTMEEENCEKIQFLDTVVVKGDRFFQNDVFRKPTDTGLYLNWSSLVPVGYTIGLAKCLLGRALTICSSWELIHNQFEYIRKTLVKNGYPNSVIDECISSVLNKGQLNVSKNNVDMPKLVLKLPYCGELSLKLKKRLCKLFRTYYPNAVLRVVFKSGFTVAKLFPFKDKVPACVRSHAVYHVKCEGCDSFYIGQTTYHVSFRVKREITSTIENSAIHQHSMEGGPSCCFKVENTNILCSDNLESRLLIKESLMISEMKPDLNRDSESTPLSLFDS